MKILHVCKDYKNRRLKYSAVLKGLGHEVNTLKIKKSTKIAGAVLSDYNMVLIRNMKYLTNNFTKDFMETAKAKGVSIVFYGSINVDVPFVEWIKGLRYVDYPFIMNKKVTEWLREGGIPAEYMPMGYYADQYHPIKGSSQVHDITFAGNIASANTFRIKAINKIIEAGLGIKVWGKDNGNKVKTKVRPYYTHKKQNSIYNSSKINIDLPWINTRIPEYRDIMHMKNRFMEIPGSGGFLLTCRTDEFEELLKDEVHCAYYDSYDDMIDKIKFYLKHPKLRDKIAKQGYDYVSSTYQFRHVFARMIDKIKNWKK